MSSVQGIPWTFCFQNPVFGVKGKHGVGGGELLGEPQLDASDPRGRSCEPGPALLRSCGQLDRGSICG